MSNIRKWADEHQYDAAPIEAQRTEDGNIIPTVKLLWMTPDPLGANAAMCRMYEGKPTYGLHTITDDERKRYFEQVQKTHLKAPFEVIKFHFFLEGVTRSFTHQMVRQRTAVYAQESLRFAVKENIAEECSMPPSIAGLKEDDPRRVLWMKALITADEAYNQLVSAGIPAEDARGLMPHAVTTRLNYASDLRNMAEKAGDRLCTQAQFEWKIVWMGIVDAIRNYQPDFSWLVDPSEGGYKEDVMSDWECAHRWQFEMIADSGMFRPICYQTGKCKFEADFDRSCTIRERVTFRAEHGGKDSNQWHKPILSDVWDTDLNAYKTVKSEGIDPAEWLLDPAAARLTGGGGHE